MMSPKTTIFSLPKEIRLQIWALAYHNEAPRTVALSTDPHRLPSPSPAPAMYNLCRESREETRFQARLSNHLVSLQQSIPDTNSSSSPSSPLPNFEVVFRYGVDRLLIADTHAHPPRPTWADKLSWQEQRLRDFDRKKLIPGCELFKRRCHRALITELYIDVSTTGSHPRLSNLVQYAGEYPALRLITFSLQAFQCLSDREKEHIRSLARMGAPMVKVNLLQIVAQLEGAPVSRKRRRDDFIVGARVCVWRQHEPCALEQEVWLRTREEELGTDKIRLFVRHIPDFQKAMQRFVKDRDPTQESEKVGLAIQEKEGEEGLDPHGVQRVG